jgi:hypothetical protein
MVEIGSRRTRSMKVEILSSVLSKDLVPGSQENVRETRAVDSRTLTPGR